MADPVRVYIEQSGCQQSPLCINNLSSRVLVRITPDHSDFAIADKQAGRDVPFSGLKYLGVVYEQLWHRCIQSGCH